MTRIRYIALIALVIAVPLLLTACGAQLAELPARCATSLACVASPRRPKMNAQG